jgi:hypothetical protein
MARCLLGQRGKGRVAPRRDQECIDGAAFRRSDVRAAAGPVGGE